MLAKVFREKCMDVNRGMDMQLNNCIKMLMVNLGDVYTWILCEF